MTGASLLPRLLLPRLQACFLAILMLAMASDAGAVVNVTSVLRGTSTDNRISWVTISLSNPMSRPLEGRLEFGTYGYQHGQSFAVVQLAPLPPGASRTVNVAVPLDAINHGRLIEKNGDETNLSIQNTYRSGPQQMFLFVAEQSQRPTDEEADAFTYRMLPGESSLYMGSHGSSSTTRTLSPSERIVTHITPTDLPENWLCYVPIQYVIMDESTERRLTAPQRMALETWVEAGGRMVLFGAEGGPLSEYRKRGEVYRTQRNPLLDKSYNMEMYSPTLPVAHRILSTTNPYAETTAGGRGGAFMLATLFLIIVGPVNYFYFLKRGEIRKLIVTVPLISVAFCSLIAVYFVFTQGFNRKGGTISLTTVDEDTNRAMTYARHSLLTGLYPMGGFRFGAETHFLPRLSDNFDAATFDVTRERVLTKGMFQPGIAFDYATLTPYTTRERMLYNAAEGTVRNGFELPVKAVAVFQQGRYFTGGAAAPGAEIKLTAVDEAALQAVDSDGNKPRAEVQLVYLLGRQQLETAEMSGVATLAADTLALDLQSSTTIYAAIFDGKPKSSDAGLEITDGHNLHILVGKAESGEAQP